MNHQFVKGYTNNHLTWVMVDATDFATPESALSAATKIKIYGKVKGATGVKFVSSGTGSLTNDIQHVGASALGIYTIALAKADLSDASAAWYDQYIISLSATGAAYQALVVDGGIWISDLSAVSSDIRSNVSDLQSDFQSRVPKLVANNSQVSDLASDLRSVMVLVQSLASDAHSAAAQANSRCLVIQSLASDVDSALTSRFSDLLSLVTTTGVQLNASSLSDLRSAISAGPGATVTASDISDIASAVWANTIGARVDSRVLKVLSDTSDLTSRITGAAATKSQVASATYALFASFMSDVTSAFAANSDAISDLKSVVTVTGVQLNASSLSDLRSAISAGAGATVTASDISDIASAVRAALVSDLSDILSAAQQTNSRTLVVQSHASNIYSMLSDLQSDFQSRVPKAVATNSQLSDLASDLKSVLTVNASVASDIYSLLSDVASDMTVTSAVISDILSAATAIKAKTDPLTFTVANQVDANIQYVNDVQVTGTGTTGDEWGP